MVSAKISIAFMLFALARSNVVGVLKCGATSSLKSNVLQSGATAPENCVYNIKATNAKMCQIKLEFESFALAQPTIEAYARCTLDKMVGTDLELCGENTGQHVYMPFPSNRVITLSFTTANRLLNPQLPRPGWNIKVTQMDCTTNNLATIAPKSCLQYFSASSGIIESFNFNNGRGPYLGNMQYAICLHKPQPQSRIRFTVTYFSLGYGANDTRGFDDDCVSSVPSPGRSEDHLLIPGAEIWKTPLVLRVDKFCGQSLMSSQVTSSMPGPFIMYWNSDTVYEGVAKPEIGFRIHYELI